MNAAFDPTSFLRRRQGAVGAMAVLAMPILVLAVGAGIDYGRAENIRSQMQQAADAAALAMANAQVFDQDAVVEARPIVDANIGVIDRFRLVGVDAEEDGRGFARVTVTGAVELFFMGLAGFDEMDVVVTSTAEFDTFRDLQFTVAIDNSPSMLIGATPDDITQLEANFSCAFACHYPGADTYTPARAMGIDTRLDAARGAVLRAFEIAEDNVYADHGDTFFNIDVFNRDIAEVADGRASELLADAATAVGGIMPVPRPASFIYELTNYDAIIGPLTTEVLDRLADQPERLHFLLILTDGVANYRLGSRQIEPLDPAICDAVKDAGVRIGVIYTTYFPLPGNHLWDTRVSAFEDDIGGNLRQCASPGWFFEAAFADDIDAAFEELMRLAIPRPVLTE